MTGPALPAEIVPCRAGRLTRIREADGAAVAAAVGESLDHLRPWLSWATEAAAEVSAQIVRCREAEQMWTRGSDFIYVLRPADGDAVLGTFGLHRRLGPGAIELGYWVHVAHTGRRYATAAAAALTDTALALADVDRIEIHTDEANPASAAIPQRLAFRLDRVEPHPLAAPAESGRRQIWVR